MRAVNLVPSDARRGAASRGAGNRFAPASLGPAQVVVAALVIAIGLVALRVLANNSVKDKQATLANLQSQVSIEQAQSAKLSVYTSFVQAAQQREAQVQEIAEQRFGWQRTLDQIAQAMPEGTSLTSLSATTAATASVSGAATSGPSFSLSGCAHTPNQNGTATLLRRLQLLGGIANVGFQSSTRAVSCGDSFSLNLDFNAVGAETTTASSTTAVPATTTSPVPASTTTTPAG